MRLKRIPLQNHLLFRLRTVRADQVRAGSEPMRVRRLGLDLEALLEDAKIAPPLR